MANIRTEEEILEEIDNKLHILKQYQKVGSNDMARKIATQLVVLHWMIGSDGYHYYEPYDEIPI